MPLMLSELIESAQYSLDKWGDIPVYVDIDKDEPGVFDIVELLREKTPDNRIRRFIIACYELPRPNLRIVK